MKRNNDNKTLMDLQSKFKNGDCEAWRKAWEIVFTVAKKNTVKMIASRNKKLFPSYDVDSIAMSATTVLMGRFKRLPNYEIKKNWVSTICFCVRNSLDNNGFLNGSTQGGIQTQFEIKIKSIGVSYDLFE